MSLRKALDALPDDRDSHYAAQEVVAFFSNHPELPVTPKRVSRATGLSVARVEGIIAALTDAFVLDCSGSDEPAYVLVPTPILSLEIQRFLRSAPARGSVQRGAQRFRDRYGTR